MQTRGETDSWRQTSRPGLQACIQVTINLIATYARIHWARGLKYPQLPVDGRLRVEQQRHQVANLLFAQDARVAEARHVRACLVGLGVPQLAPGVVNDGFAVGRSRVTDAAQLAVVVQAGADRAVGQLGLADLVAVVAAAAIGIVCLVGPGQAPAVLGNSFAFNPVAQQLAVSGGI